MLNENHNLIVTAKLRAAQFNTGMASMNKRIRGFSGSITGLQGALIALPFAAVGAMAVKAAADLESAERRFKVSFGNLQDYGNDFQEGITDALGRTRGEILTSMVSFKQFFQGLGFARTSSAMLSKELAGLSLDLAAFFNISDQAATKKFVSALAGSPEVLDQYGINLKEAAVKQELLSMGIQESVQKASEFNKTLARMNIVRDVMGKNGLLGFATKNVDLFTNRLKELQGRVKTLAISFGKELLPVVKSAVERLSSLVQSFSEMSAIDKKKIMGLVIAFSALPLAISALSGSITILTGLQSILGRSMVTYIGAAAALYVLVDAFKKFQEKDKLTMGQASLLDKLEGSNADEKIASIDKEIEKLQEGLGSDKGFFTALKDAFLVDVGIGTPAQRYAQDLMGLKTALKEGGDEFLKLQTTEEAFGDSIKESLDGILDKAKTVVSSFTDTISEGIFGGADKGGKRDPMKMLFPDLESKSAAKSLGIELVDTVGQALINARSRIAESVRSLPEGLPLEEVGRRIGRKLSESLGGGIAVGLEDVRSLIESFRDVLTSSLTGVFESLGSFAVDKDADNFKKNLLGILGSAFTAVGSAVIAFGTALLNLNAQAIMLNGAGVIAAGGAMVALGSAISTTAKRSFGGTSGTAASAQFTGQQLNGQSSFGQVLVAEVEYDKLRFVLQNGQSSSFRSNG